jgi:hypothetical protein
MIFASFLIVDCDSETQGLKWEVDLWGEIKIELTLEFRIEWSIEWSLNPSWKLIVYVTSEGFWTY